MSHLVNISNNEWVEKVICCLQIGSYLIFCQNKKLERLFFEPNTLKGNLTMKKLLLITITLVLFPLAAFALNVDVQDLGSIKVGEPIKQVAPTADGQRIYVLTKSNVIRLYDIRGQLVGEAKTGGTISSIAPFVGNRVILQDDANNAMKVIALEPIANIDTTGAATLGPKDAPVEMVVFDDFECPYCGQAAPMLKQAQAAYPDKVKLVFKHFPLSFHKHALPAAKAGIAAQKQGKFWELHDLLFQNQKNLGGNMINDLAKKAGLNMDQFAKDMADPALDQQIKKDFVDGQQIGVRGTPSIFINGRRVQQRSLAAMRQMIEAELAQSDPKVAATK